MTSWFHFWLHCPRFCEKCIFGQRGRISLHHREIIKPQIICGAIDPWNDDERIAASSTKIFPFHEDARGKGIKLDWVFPCEWNFKVSISRYLGFNSFQMRSNCFILPDKVGEIETKKIMVGKKAQTHNNKKHSSNGIRGKNVEIGRFSIFARAQRESKKSLKKYRSFKKKKLMEEFPFPCVRHGNVVNSIWFLCRVRSDWWSRVKSEQNFIGLKHECVCTSLLGYLLPWPKKKYTTWFCTSHCCLPVALASWCRFFFPFRVHWNGKIGY